ncbi:uncharacterized protein LOC103524116 [Trichonephila clavipes]|nr:uncharacterized protein LOC103524116 [Trichonephila clavipes]
MATLASGYGHTRQGLPQGYVSCPVLFNIMINGCDVPPLGSTSLEASVTNCANYLGISLDSRLTWTKHIAKVVENTTSRLSLLKRIADIKWGSSQSVLTFSFTSDIKPVIDYGSELLVTASDSPLSKLDIFQNKALRFVTGAATSTPIASMQLQTEMHFWPKYIPSHTRLKIQHTFLFEFQRLANVFGVSDNRLPLFRPTIFPGHLRYASANLDLVLPVLISIIPFWLS